MFVQVLRRLQEHGIKLKKHQSASSSNMELDTSVGLFSAMASLQIQGTQQPYTI